MLAKDKVLHRLGPGYVPLDLCNYSPGRLLPDRLGDPNEQRSPGVDPPEMGVLRSGGEVAGERNAPTMSKPAGISDRDRQKGWSLVGRFFGRSAFPLVKE